MEPLITQIGSYGVAGLAIALLILWLRDTQAKLLVEKDARIADATKVLALAMELQQKSHARDAELTRAIDGLGKVADRLVDLYDREVRAPMASKPNLSRGGE